MRAGALLAVLLLLGAAPPEAPLALVGLDGTRTQLAPRGDETLVLHFWATWCPSCVGELAELARAARACTGTPLRVVAVNAGEDAQRVAAFVSEHRIELPVLLDPRGRVFRGVAGRELPANLFWTATAAELVSGPHDAAWWRSELAARGCSAPHREGAGE